MRLVKPLLICLVIAGAQSLAVAAWAAPVSGKGGGAPAPLLGVTLLGQLGGAAGIFAAWRKRRDKNKK